MPSRSRGERRSNAVASALGAAVLLSSLAARAPAQLASAVHFVTEDNLTCFPFDSCTALSGTSWSFLHPEALHLATSNFNPSGSLEGVHFAAPIGAGLDPLNPAQAVLRGPAVGAMPVGSASNLLTVRGEQSCLFAHTSTAENTSSNVTYLDHPAMNDDPGAFLLVLPDGQLPPTTVGVYYEGTRHQWGIFNEDQSAMTVGRRFTAYVNGCDVGLGTRGPITCTDPQEEACGGTGTAIASGDPGAKILVTQRWNGVYNPHPIGVLYDPFAQAWKVFNEDLADMPVDARFNVAVIDVLLADDFESGDTAGWFAVTP